MLKTPTAQLLLLITTLVVALGSARPSELGAATKPTPGKKILLFSYLCDQARFNWTWEDVYRPGRPAFSYGISKIRILPPPKKATVGQIVHFLRQQVPNAKIWRDAVNRGIVHFADRRVLRWSKYPLNKKLTFHGTMSFLQLESGVFRRLIPAVYFFGPPQRPGPGAIGVPPNSKSLQIVTRFKEKAVTLRRFLTTGVQYHGGPDGGRELWQAGVRVAGRGKFTGRVDIYFVARPRFVPAAARPKAR